MMSMAMGARLGIVVLAALLALPLAPATFPVGAKSRARTVNRTFANTTNIALPNGANSPISSSSRYPSTIHVDELPGAIRDVNLRLNDMSHFAPDELEVLLVGPRGQTAIVMANVGRGTDIDDVTLALDDEAAAPLPNSGPLQSGTFRPTNAEGSAIAFNDPAPAAGANADLSIFDGTNPNGIWTLFVQDAYGPTNPGSIIGGWELEITTQVKARKKR